MKPKTVFPQDGRPLNVLGDNQLIKLTGEDTGGAFTVIEQTNPPGIGIPLHVHQNEDELFYIEGSMAFTVVDQPVVAQAGTMVFLPRGVPHEFVTTGDVPVKTLITTFPSGIEHMFEELGALPIGPPDMTQVFEICARFGVTFLLVSDAGSDNAA